MLTTCPGEVAGLIVFLFFEPLCLQGRQCAFPSAQPGQVGGSTFARSCVMRQGIVWWNVGGDVGWERRTCVVWFIAGGNGGFDDVSDVPLLLYGIKGRLVAR